MRRFCASLYIALVCNVVTLFSIPFKTNLIQNFPIQLIRSLLFLIANNNPHTHRSLFFICNASSYKNWSKQGYFPMFCNVFNKSNFMLLITTILRLSLTFLVLLKLLKVVFFSLFFSIYSINYVKSCELLLIMKLKVMSFAFEGN